MGGYKGSKTLLMQSLCFFDMVQYQMKTFSAACKKYPTKKVLPPSFCFPYTRLQCARNGQFGIIPPAIITFILNEMNGHQLEK